MIRRLLSCIICIFLFALSSVRAQSSLQLQAVEYERVLFEGAPPRDANVAIASRADILMRLGRYGEAAACLERLRLFALSKSEREALCELRVECLYRSGRYSDAAAYIEEFSLPDRPENLVLKSLVSASVRDFETSRVYALKAGASGVDSLYSHAPRLKSPSTAMFLGIVPPALHFYTHRTDLWWASLGTAASAVFIVGEAISGNWLTAVLGGGLLLNGFYVENGLRPAQNMALEYNARSLEKFLSQLEILLDF